MELEGCNNKGQITIKYCDWNGLRISGNKRLESDRIFIGLERSEQKERSE